MVSSSFSDEVVSVTKLRKEMTAMLEKVRSGVPVTIMQGDTADVAIVRRRDYSKLEEDVRELSRQIAESHGGTLTLENSPSGGATARLLIPLDLRASEPVASLALPPAASD